MHKIYSIAFSLALMSATTLNVMAEGIHVGYCEGVMGDNPQGYGMSNNTISAAVLITPEMLAPYASCHLTSVYVGIPEGASTYPTTLTGWLRADKEGSNLAVGTVECQTGWLTITLDKAIDVDAYLTTGIWAGFDYTQPKKSNILAFGGATNVPNAGYIAKNGKWTDFSSFGVHSIEAVIEGDGLPQHDLRVVSSSPARAKNKIGEPAVINVVVQNMALTQAEGFKLSYSVNDGAVTGNLNYADVLNYRDKAELALSIPTDALEPGVSTITLQVDWADGSVDDFAADNVGQCVFSTYDVGFDHIILLEEFTTEKCPNCPPAVTRLNSALDDYNLRDKVVWVCQHAGYYTDFLTIPESETFCKLYGSGGTYAPAMMVDRTYNPTYVDTPGVVGGVGYPNQIAAWLSSMLDEPSFVKVDITSAIYHEGEITIKVRAEKAPGFELQTEHPCLNVWIKESEIEMRAQSGYSGPRPGHHEFALRKVLTSTWGDEFQWDGMTYEKEFTITPASEWVIDNLEVVAFISRYNASNMRECEVFNTTQSIVTNDSASEGISNITADAVSGRQAYTIDGRATSNASGLSIIGGQVIFIAK